MEFATAFIFEFIFKVMLCFTGAFVRWVFLWKKKSYASLLDDDQLNFFIGIILILLPLIIVTLCKHFM